MLRGVTGRCGVLRNATGCGTLRGASERCGTSRDAAGCHRTLRNASQHPECRRMPQDERRRMIRDERRRMIHDIRNTSERFGTLEMRCAVSACFATYVMKDVFCETRFVKHDMGRWDATKHPETRLAKYPNPESIQSGPNEGRTNTQTTTIRHSGMLFASHTSRRGPG